MDVKKAMDLQCSTNKDSFLLTLVGVKLAGIEQFQSVFLM